MKNRMLIAVAVSLLLIVACGIYVYHQHRVLREREWATLRRLWSHDADAAVSLAKFLVETDFPRTDRFLEYARAHAEEPAGCMAAWIYCERAKCEPPADLEVQYHLFRLCVGLIRVDGFVRAKPGEPFEHLQSLAWLETNSSRMHAELSSAYDVDYGLLLARAWRVCEVEGADRVLRLARMPGNLRGLTKRSTGSCRIVSDLIAMLQDTGDVQSLFALASDADHMTPNERRALLETLVRTWLAHPPAQGGAGGFVRNVLRRNWIDEIACYELLARLGDLRHLGIMLTRAENRRHNGLARLPVEQRKGLYLALRRLAPLLAHPDVTAKPTPGLSVRLTEDQRRWYHKQYFALYCDSVALPIESSYLADSLRIIDAAETRRLANEALAEAERELPDEPADPMTGPVTTRLTRHLAALLCYCGDEKVRIREVQGEWWPLWVSARSGHPYALAVLARSLDRTGGARNAAITLSALVAGSPIRADLAVFKVERLGKGPMSLAEAWDECAGKDTSIDWPKRYKEYYDWLVVRLHRLKFDPATKTWKLPEGPDE